MTKKRLVIIGLIILGIILGIIANMSTILVNLDNLINNGDESTLQMQKDVINGLDLFIKSLEGKSSAGIKISDSSNVTLKDNVIEGFDIGIDIQSSRDIQAINNQIKESEKSKFIEALKEIKSELQNNPDEKEVIKNKLDKLTEFFGHITPIARLGSIIAQAFL